MGTVDEIKQRLDIVDVLSEYLHLEKSGRNFRALCPFHTEKTPSFFVSPERQSWRCFGCGAGGDIFGFVMKKEGIDFSEALKILAQRAGVALVAKRKTDEKQERLYRINDVAAGYYHHLLLESAAGKTAQLYLERRAISNTTIAEFQLGYSLDSWDEAKRYLTSKGFSEEELISSGLLVESERGGYDRFRGRLMFPIGDPRGRILGFGARALDDSLPKYLNSPFDKGTVLYGLDRAKQAIREQNTAIIVEGYMDVLTAHQHGFKNVVASMGTSLTERQIAALKGLGQNVIMALDADAAGSEATLRELDSVWHAGDPRPRRSYRVQELNISIINMPPGKDPDELIREDTAGWHSMVEQAIPWLEFVFQAVTSPLDLAKPGNKSIAVEKLAPYLAAMPDQVQKAHYVQKLAELVQLREYIIWDALRAKGRRQQASIASSAGSGDPTEEYCLSLLLRYPELREKIENLSAEHFEQTENRELFLAWRDDQETMEQGLDPNLQEHLVSISTRQLPPLEEREREQALEQCIRRLEARRLRSQHSFQVESSGIDAIYGAEGKGA